ncbi:hypothetical protein ACYULU_02800 [Breznakiellaceae bacterium SP9]
MTIQQTIEVPADHRFTIEIPSEIPAGKTMLTLTPVPEQVSADTEPMEDFGDYLARNSPSTMEEALAEAERKFNDPNRKPLSSFLGTVKGVYGDGVAYQRNLRDEWDD